MPFVARLAAVVVLAMIAAVLHQMFYEDIHDAILNTAVNYGLGTDDVDYANHLDPNEYEFEFNEQGELINTGRRKQPGQVSPIKPQVYPSPMAGQLTPQEPKSGAEAIPHRKSPFKTSPYRNGVPRKPYRGQSSDAQQSPF